MNVPSAIVGRQPPVLRTLFGKQTVPRNKKRGQVHCVTCEAGIRVLISRGQEGNRDEINKTEA